MKQGDEVKNKNKKNLERNGGEGRPKMGRWGGEKGFCHGVAGKRGLSSRERMGFREGGGSVFQRRGGRGFYRREGLLEKIKKMVNQTVQSERLRSPIDLLV